MRHGCRMIDQRFHPAEAFSKREYFGGRQQLHCAFNTIILQREAHHSSKSSHLLFCHRKTWMVFKAAPVHISNLFVITQKVRDLLTVVAMSFHPEVQRF